MSWYSQRLLKPGPRLSLDINQLDIGLLFPAFQMVWLGGWRARTYQSKASFQRTQCKYTAGLYVTFFLMENCFLPMLSGITCNAALLPSSSHTRLHPTPKTVDHWVWFTSASLLSKHFSHCLHAVFRYCRGFFNNAHQRPLSRIMRLQCLPLYIAFL